MCMCMAVICVCMCVCDVCERVLMCTCTSVKGSIPASKLYEILHNRPGPACLFERTPNKC